MRALWLVLVLVGCSEGVVEPEPVKEEIKDIPCVARIDTIIQPPDTTIHFVPCP